MTAEQRSLCAALSEAKAEYTVVGGVAVNAYGYLRSTQDMDLFIRPTVENAKLVFAALQAWGVHLPGDYTDLLLDYESLRFGEKPNQVDLLNSIGGPSFDQVWRNRVDALVDGQIIPFISKADLIACKERVGRLRDLADVEELRLIPDMEPEPSSE